MISQSTDWCLPHRHCCPLSFIKKERGGKKNGEKTLCLDNFADLSLTFFQLNCHFWDKRAQSMISQPTDRCFLHCHCRPLAFMKTEQGGKKNGKKTLHRLTILLFYCPPCFNKIAIFGVNTCSMVLQATDQFLPHRNCRLLEFIKTEWGGKKNGEKTLCLENFTVLLPTLFQ